MPGVFSGIAAIFLMIPLILVPLSGAGGGAPAFVYCVDLFGFVSGISALIMMAMRQRYVAMPEGTQKISAAAIWGIHLLAFLVVAGHVIGLY